MKVVQVIWNLGYGDGVSNCVFSVSEILNELNYSNYIIAFFLDKQIKNKNVVKKEIYEPIAVDADDILIYHFSHGCPSNYIVENMACKKILVYHNITTPDFFRGVNDDLFRACLWGMHDAAKTVGKYLKAVVMSEFSKSNLLEMGWRAEDIQIIPLIKAHDKEIKINSVLADSYTDDYVNILFTGRIAPNKKIEDIIRIFSYYQKNVNPKSRLFLVGWIQCLNYYDALVRYVQSLKVQDVVFTGHVANEDLEAYYAVSDIFLCMSEHEGFCIPLLEAMKRETPVIAYSAAAVPDTLGNAGILVETKDEGEIAEIINRLISDPEYRKKIIQSQNKRVSSLGLEDHKLELKKIIDEVSQMEDFSYALETKEISIPYYVGKKPDFIKDIENLCESNETIVIYGAGKVGQSLLRGCKSWIRGFLKKFVICDNGFEESSYDGIPVINHEECIKRYPSALYIVTPQMNCVEIIANLVRDNIDKSRIKFLNSTAQKIV